MKINREIIEKGVEEMNIFMIVIWSTRKHNRIESENSQIFNNKQIMRTKETF